MCREGAGSAAADGGLTLSREDAHVSGAVSKMAAQGVFGRCRAGPYHADPAQAGGGDRTLLFGEEEAPQPKAIKKKDSAPAVKKDSAPAPKRARRERQAPGSYTSLFGDLADNDDKKGE